MKALVTAGIYLAVAGLCVEADQVRADPLLDFSLSPLRADLGPADFILGGTAQGALYTRGEPGQDRTSVTGALVLTPELRRVNDTGLVLALKGVVRAAHDSLSEGRYDARTLEKLYVDIETGLGRIEVGQTDGAGYSLSMTGPKVDPDVSIEDAETSFFSDPTTGKAFIRHFRLATSARSTSNFAKVALYTPKLFGIQVGLSFTPSEGRNVLPFVSDGPQVANRQQDIWEAAGVYARDFGAFTWTNSAAFAVGHNAAKTLGHAGLTDWSLGSVLDYALDDDAGKLSLGASFRSSNAHGFDVNEVLAHSTTRAFRFSGMAQFGQWLAGAEYVDGTSDGGAGLPTIGARGTGLSAGYSFNDNLQATVGWQHLIYSESAGVFYTGSGHIRMNAGYVHLRLHV